MDRLHRCRLVDLTGVFKPRGRTFNKAPQPALELIIVAYMDKFYTRSTCTFLSNEHIHQQTFTLKCYNSEHLYLFFIHSPPIWQ